MLRQELEARLAKDDHEFEWADVIQDLDRLQVVEVEQDGKWFLLRSEVQGTRGTVFRAAGVAVPPNVQQATQDPADPDPVLGATQRVEVVTYLHDKTLRLYTVANQSRSRSWRYMRRSALESDEPVPRGCGRAGANDYAAFLALFFAEPF